MASGCQTYAFKFQFQEYDVQRGDSLHLSWHYKCTCYMFTFIGWVSVGFGGCVHIWVDCEGLCGSQGSHNAILTIEELIISCLQKHFFWVLLLDYNTLVLFSSLLKWKWINHTGSYHTCHRADHCRRWAQWRQRGGHHQIAPSGRRTFPGQQTCHSSRS